MPRARLSWPSRQLLSARKSTVSYRILSARLGDRAFAGAGPRLERSAGTHTRPSAAFDTGQFLPQTEKRV